MKKKLIFKNKIPKQFIKYKEYVNEVINDYFNSLDLDCELKIKFIDFISANEYEIADCVLKNISYKKHELLITNSVLNSINFDGGKFFCLSIYHEFEHIRDYNNMMETGLFKFNLCLSLRKNFKNEYVSTGFLFWTEVYAYYQTLMFSKQCELNFEEITFGNLAKIYAKTIDINKRLYYKKDLNNDEAIKYINCVDSFVYLCAKYMASVYANHSKVPYVKINKNKEYKKVYSILCGIEPKVKRLIRNPYSQKSYSNLFKLGKYICENVRWKIFDVGLSEKNGEILSFY